MTDNQKAEEKKERLEIELLASESFVKDLKTALEVKPDVLRQVAEIVNKDSGIQAKGNKDLLRFWATTGLAHQTLQDSVSVLKFLFDTSVEKKVSVENVLTELSDLCNTRQIAGFEERRESLRAFLTPKERYLVRSEMEPYAVGVVRNLYSISGSVQIRAAFKSPKSTEIVGYLPIVQIRLGTKCDTEESATEYQVFQVDEHRLRKLLDKLGLYMKQLHELKTRVKDIIPVYEDLQEENDDDE